MDLSAIAGSIREAGGKRDEAVTGMQNANSTDELMIKGMEFQEAQIKMDTLSKSANQALKAAGDALKDSIDKSA